MGAAVHLRDVHASHTAPLVAVTPQSRPCPDCDEDLPTTFRPEDNTFFPIQSVTLQGKTMEKFVLVSYILYSS